MYECVKIYNYVLIEIGTIIDGSGSQWTSEKRLMLASIGEKTTHTHTHSSIKLFAKIATT